MRVRLAPLQCEKEEKNLASPRAGAEKARSGYGCANAGNRGEGSD